MGPLNATINVTGTHVQQRGTHSVDGREQRRKLVRSRVSPTGMFQSGRSGPGTHTINYAVGQAPVMPLPRHRLRCFRTPPIRFCDQLARMFGPDHNAYPKSGRPNRRHLPLERTGFNTVGPNPSRPNATLAMGGTYSMYMVSGGCTSSTATQMVTVNPTDPAPAIVTNAPVCHGMPVMLDGPATASSQYFWSGPNGFTGNTEDATLPVTDYSMTGTYSLYLVTNTPYIGRGYLARVEITVPPKPVIDAVQPLCFKHAHQPLR